MDSNAPTGEPSEMGVISFSPCASYLRSRLWSGLAISSVTQSMSNPQFVIGDIVQYRPDLSQDRQTAVGLYEILRQMPLEHAGHSYRIKSKIDGHERIAREHQLEKVV
jgi:hypothetical protein